MWLTRQRQYYNSNQYIMKNENIREKWKIFVIDNKYKHYFIKIEN